MLTKLTYQQHKCSAVKINVPKWYINWSIKETHRSCYRGWCLGATSHPKAILPIHKSEMSKDIILSTHHQNCHFHPLHPRRLIILLYYTIILHPCVAVSMLFLKWLVRRFVIKRQKKMVVTLTNKKLLWINETVVFLQFKGHIIQIIRWTYISSNTTWKHSACYTLKPRLRSFHVHRNNANINWCYTVRPAASLISKTRRCQI